MSRATFYFPPQYLCINSLLNTLQNINTQPVFSITNTQILPTGLRHKYQQHNPSPSKVIPTELGPQMSCMNLASSPHLAFRKRK